MTTKLTLKAAPYAKILLLVSTFLGVFLVSGEDVAASGSGSASAAASTNPNDLQPAASAGATAAMAVSPPRGPSVSLDGESSAKLTKEETDLLKQSREKLNEVADLLKQSREKINLVMLKIQLTAASPQNARVMLRELNLNPSEKLQAFLEGRLPNSFKQFLQYMNLKDREGLRPAMRPDSFGEDVKIRGLRGLMIENLFNPSNLEDRKYCFQLFYDIWQMLKNNPWKVGDGEWTRNDFKNLDIYFGDEAYKRLTKENGRLLFEQAAKLRDEADKVKMSNAAPLLLQEKRREAHIKLKSAADHGYGPAMAYIGFLYQSGTGPYVKDRAKALDLYNKALASGDLPETGGVMGINKESVTTQVREINTANASALLFEQAAKLKDEADKVKMSNAAPLLLQEKRREAHIKLKSAADHGYGPAMAYIGFLYQSGTGPYVKDRAKALDLYNKALASGDLPETGGVMGINKESVTTQVREINTANASAAASASASSAAATAVTSAVPASAAASAKK